MMFLKKIIIYFLIYFNNTNFINANKSNDDSISITKFGSKINLIKFIEKSQAPILITRCLPKFNTEKLKPWLFTSWKYPNSDNIGTFCEFTERYVYFFFENCFDKLNEDLRA